MRDSNLEFRIVDRGPMPEPSNFGYAAIISLESGLLSKRAFVFIATELRVAYVQQAVCVRTA